MAKFCENCGKELKANVKFCENCGKSIKGGTKTTSNNKTKDNETLTGMDSRSEVILVYLIPLVGLIAALMKDRHFNEFSLYHYRQAATLWIVNIIVGLGTSIFAFLVLPAIAGGIVEIVLFVYTIMALIRGYQGEKYEIPVIKDLTLQIWK